MTQKDTAVISPIRENAFTGRLKEQLFNDRGDHEEMWEGESLEMVAKEVVFDVGDYGHQVWGKK